MSASTAEDREIILRDKAAREGFSVPQDVIDFLVARFETETKLKSELINIAMFAAHRGIPIDLDVAKLIVDGERVRPLSTMIPGAEADTDTAASDPAAVTPSSPLTNLPPTPAPAAEPVSLTSATAKSAADNDVQQMDPLPSQNETLFSFDNTEHVTHDAAPTGPASDVYFIPLRTQRKRSLLERINLAMTRVGIDSMIIGGDKVAVKVHFGEEGNTGFVSPLYARAVVTRLKELEAKP
ncbi:MAG: hypothetical protein FWE46_06055, partial [Coriobacteriia bacterium]|nr:hypothetical protein [Coriobacteriia bacterium]